MTTVQTTVVQPKWAVKSISIWSTIIGAALMAYQVAGPIISGFGVDVPVTPEDINNVKNLGSNLIVAAASVAAFVGGIFGRWKAGRIVAPISMLPNADPVRVAVVRADR